MDEYWTCAATNPKEETQALRHLRTQGFECFFPFFIQRDKYRHYSNTPLFPGYIFVLLEPDIHWHIINYTPHVLRVLSACGTERPCSVPNDFIHSIRRAIHPQDLSLIPVGAQVRVTKGIFEGKESIVSWSEKDRIGLLFNILGRDSELTLNANDVEVV